jgi:hypothetical protein
LLLISFGDIVIETPPAGLVVATVNCCGVLYEAITAFTLFIVTLQTVPSALSHPLHELKLLPPAVAGAVTLTVVPFLYARFIGVAPFPTPLLSFGDMTIETPLAGFNEDTLNCLKPAVSTAVCVLCSAMKSTGFLTV